MDEAFKMATFSVSRYAAPSSKIWTDVALEQTVKWQSKTKGGIAGFTLKPCALDRWYIKAHVRADITAATTELCGICYTLLDLFTKKLVEVAR